MVVPSVVGSPSNLRSTGHVHGARDHRSSISPSTNPVSKPNADFLFRYRLSYHNSPKSENRRETLFPLISRSRKIPGRLGRLYNKPDLRDHVIVKTTLPSLLFPPPPHITTPDSAIVSSFLLFFISLFPFSPVPVAGEAFANVDT